MKSLEFVGRSFGAISVLSEAEAYYSPKGHRDRQFECRCDCGREWTVRSSALRRGQTDCGCQRKRVISHGYAPRGGMTPTYRIWAGILQRCCNPKSSAFKHYGGRGITVCDAWKESFEAFLADMGERPSGLSIDRRDNEKGYEPGNCEWATNEEQARNRRNNHKLDGETLTEASRRLGLNHTAILRRLKRGWSEERAFTTPRWHKSKN